MLVQSLTTIYDIKQGFTCKNADFKELVAHFMVSCELWDFFFGLCINWHDFEIQILYNFPENEKKNCFMPPTVVKNNICIFVNKYIRQFKLLLQMNRQNYLQQRDKGMS